MTTDKKENGSQAAGQMTPLEKIEQAAIEANDERVLRILEYLKKRNPKGKSLATAISHSRSQALPAI